MYIYAPGAGYSGEPKLVQSGFEWDSSSYDNAVAPSPSFVESLGTSQSDVTPSCSPDISPVIKEEEELFVLTCQRYCNSCVSVFPSFYFYAFVVNRNLKIGIFAILVVVILFTNILMRQNLMTWDTKTSLLRPRRR